MIKINVNNNQVLEISQEIRDGEITINKVSAIEEETKKITSGDFVTMLNWYQYQKSIGNENLEF